MLKCHDKQLNSLNNPIWTNVWLTNNSTSILTTINCLFSLNCKNDVFYPRICKHALYESSEWFCHAPRKPANPCLADAVYGVFARIVQCALTKSVRMIERILAVYAIYNIGSLCGLLPASSFDQHSSGLQIMLHHIKREIHIKFCLKLLLSSLWQVLS